MYCNDGRCECTNPGRLNYVPWRLSVEIASSRPSPGPTFLESMCTSDASNVSGICVEINDLLSSGLLSKNLKIKLRYKEL